MAKIPVTDCPAGPALDAAVAQALGHLVAHRLDFGKWFIASDDDALREGLKYGEFFELSEGLGIATQRYCSTMPKYSSRIEAAWELVEFASIPELVGAALGGQPTTVLRFGFSISRALKEDTGSPDDEWGYRANFMSRTALGPKTTWAATAPLAITRAFLLAHNVTEVEVQE